jgi:hypothetical protein
MRTSIRRPLLGATALVAVHCGGASGATAVDADGGDSAAEADAADGGGDATAEGGPSKLIVLPPLMDFGVVACGATSTLPASARTVSMTTLDGEPFTWSATLRGGATSPYVLSASSGTVAAGGTGAFVVGAKPIPSTSATTAGLYADVLTITTDRPWDSPHTVSLLQNADGVILAFAPTAQLSLGNVPVGMATKGTFTVTNSGRAPATVGASISGAPAFTLSPGSLGTLMGGGGSAQGTVSFSPTAAATQSATVSLSVGPGDALCAPLPHLTVTGTGI